MKNVRWIICCAALALALGACSTSNAHLVDAYRAPGTVSFVFNRVAVIVLNGSHDLRSSLEDEVVKTAGGTRLVASHTVLSEADARSAEAVRQALLDKKFDGAVTMRIIRPDEVNPAESSRGESFMTYAESAALSGEPAFGGKVLIETTIYRLEDSKLVWRGIVENPKTTDAHATVRETVHALADHMRDTGLIH